jgi:hypothetical protein
VRPAVAVTRPPDLIERGLVHVLCYCAFTAMMILYNYMCLSNSPGACCSSRREGRKGLPAAGCWRAAPSGARADHQVQRQGPPRPRLHPCGAQGAVDRGGGSIRVAMGPEAAEEAWLVGVGVQLTDFLVRDGFSLQRCQRGVGSWPLGNIQAAHTHATRKQCGNKQCQNARAASRPRQQRRVAVAQSTKGLRPRSSVGGPG